MRNRYPTRRSYADAWNRLFEEAFAPAAPEPSAWTPALDIDQDSEGLRLRMDLPGVDPEGLEIRVEDGILTIAGSREENETREEGRRVYRERRQGRFERRLRLADTVDSAALRAEFKNGVLTLSAPLREEAKPREIAVSMN